MFLKILKYKFLLKFNSTRLGNLREMTTIEYQEAIKKLNNLQTNPNNIPQVQNLRKERIESTIQLCKKLGFNPSDLNRLNIIHVTGSKGKGSTCALIESILRNCGYKTGLFTSPHLIEVRERIKINGFSIDYKKFLNYFNHCHRILIEQSTYDDEFKKPIYFQFLTCMMFYVFLNENIDVAIIEVGIGGEYDSTNIIQTPVCSAITSLALEHTNILGKTLEEIAWQKSGIFKSNSVAFCSDIESKSALDVVKNRAQEKNIPLFIIKTGDYSFLNLKLHGPIQNVNCSLAIHIANYWLSKVIRKESTEEWLSKVNYENVSSNYYILDPIISLKEKFLQGLNECEWPGRNQIIYTKNPLITYYVDGAHTIESIQQFINWYDNIKQNKQDNQNDINVLLFNYTGDRNVELFLEVLMKLKFKAVAFPKLQAYNEVNKQDQIKKLTETEDSSKYDSLIQIYKNLEDKLNKTEDKAIIRTFTNVNDSIEWLTNMNIDINSNKEENKQINVIVTGSLYLVGILLQILNYKIK